MTEVTIYIFAMMVNKFMNNNNSQYVSYLVYVNIFLEKVLLENTLPTYNLNIGPSFLDSSHNLTFKRGIYCSH